MPDPTEENKMPYGPQPPKNYQQPGTVKLTDEEVNSEDDIIVPQKPDTIKAQTERAMYRQNKRRGLFQNDQRVRFDPNEAIDPEVANALAKNLSPLIQKQIRQASKKEGKTADPYIYPSIEENMSDEQLKALIPKKQKLEELNAKTFFGGATIATKAFAEAKEKGKILGFNKVDDDSELRSEFDAESWSDYLRYPAKAIGNMSIAMYNGFVDFGNLGTGMMASALMPGLTNEEEAEKERLQAEIDEVEAPLIKQEYNIKKSQYAKEEKQYDGLLNEKMSKGFTASFEYADNEKIFFRDSHLISNIKDLHQRTLEEYESKLNNEGGWGGLTEELPDMFNLYAYAALQQLADDDPEKLTPIQKGFMKAMVEFENVKQLNLNSNPYYRFFRDSFRPTLDFVGEIFVTRGAGKALGTGNMMAKAGIKGTTKSVANTLMNSALLPMTTTGALKADAENIQVVKNERGEDTILTTNASKDAFVSGLVKENIKNDLAIYQLETQRADLTEEQKKKLSKLKLKRAAYNNSLNELVDKQGELRKPETHFGKEYGKTFYETGKELVWERAGGRLDKFMRPFGNINLLSKATKFKRKLKGFEDVITKSKAGILTRSLFGHGGMGKYVHSFRGEFAEEFGVQLTPSFDVSYADQISQFANPDWYIHLAANVALLKGTTGGLGKGVQQVAMWRDKEYAKEVKTHKQNMSDLRQYVRDLDMVMTDEDLAKQVAMNSLDTKFVDLDYDATIAELRNPEKNKTGEDQKDRDRKANLLEKNKFLNAAIFAVQSKTDNELSTALGNLIKKEGVSANTRKSAAKALNMIRDLKTAFNQNKTLVDGDQISNDAFKVIMDNAISEDLRDNMKEVDIELETLEAEFIEQSDKYDAKPIEIEDINSMSSGDFSDSTVDYISDFIDYLEKKGKGHLAGRRAELERFTNMLNERRDELNAKIKEKKSEEYQNRRKADKAKAAKTKEQFDAYKEYLPEKEREEMEKLFAEPNPEEAVQEYNKKKDFKDEHTVAPDADDKAFSDLTNPKVKGNTKSNTDTKSKKADIQKRRKKELENQYNVLGSNFLVRSQANKENTKLETSEIKIAEAIIEKGIKDSLSAEEIYGKLLKRKIVASVGTPVELVKTYLQNRIDNRTKVKIGEPLSKAINAKYDAELTELEKEETEESTQPVENYGNVLSREEQQALLDGRAEMEDESQSFSKRQVEPSDDNIELAELIYSKVKGATKKKNPGVNDIVKYMVERWGWEDLSTRYDTVLSAFHNIGVDITDADDIYAKYDNPEKRLLDSIKKGPVKFEQKNLEGEEKKKAEEETNTKQDDVVKKKNTIIIDGQNMTDMRTDYVGTKFSIKSVEKQRYADSVYIDGDKLITSQTIDNNYILDPDYIDMVTQESEANPGSLTLRLFDLDDEIAISNNRQQTFKIDLEARVGDEMFKLPISLEKGETLTVGALREKLKEKGFNQEVQDEFIAMYAPMVYRFKDTNIAYAHSYYWEQEENQSKNASTTMAERDLARENSRQLRRSVMYSDTGYIPIIIKGRGRMSLNRMNDEKGNPIKKKVSEVVGEVKGYDDSKIGKIGLLMKMPGQGIQVVFNREGEINADQLLDDVKGSDAFKSIRTGKEKQNFIPVQIFPSHVEGQPYRLNLLTDNNQSGQFDKVAKETLYKVMLANVVLDKNTPEFVKQYFNNRDSSLDLNTAQKIIKAAGGKTNLESFYNAMGFTRSGVRGSKEIPNYIRLLQNSKNEKELTNNLSHIYNTMIGEQFKVHTFIGKQIFSVPIFKENSFEFDKVSYQDFLQRVYLSENRTYTMTTEDGSEKTVFSVSPQIYTSHYIGEETDMPESTTVTKKDIENEDSEETKETKTEREELIERLNKADISEDAKKLFLDRYDNGEEISGSARRIENEQEEALNNISNDRIEGLTAHQERVVSQFVIHNVALAVGQGDLKDIGRTIIKTVDDVVAKTLKEKKTFHDILVGIGGKKYLESAKAELEMMEIVSKNKVSLYNKAIRSLNETIQAEIGEIDTDDNTEQWAKDLEERETFTRLSQELKLAFYGIRKKTVKSGTVVQPYGLIEYHSNTEIYRKILDITTQIDGSWADLTGQLKNKHESYGYPVYKDMLNKLDDLDSKTKNKLLHEMTGYKATYYKGTLNKSGKDGYKTGVLDENDTRKSITIVNNLKANFKNVFGEVSGKDLNLNTRLVTNTLAGLDSVPNMDAREIKTFFDKIGFTEVNANTWYYLRVLAYPKKGNKKEVEMAQSAKVDVTLSTFIDNLRKKLQGLANKKGPLLTDYNIYDDLGKQLKTIATLESEFNHSIIGATKRIGDKNVSSKLPPMMVLDENRKFVSKDGISRNKNVPFVAEGYVYKLLTGNPKYEDTLKLQLQKMSFPSLEVLKVDNKLIGSDPNFTKQGALENFVYKTTLYTSKRDNESSLKDLKLLDYPELNFIPKKLVGLTAADKKRTYIHTLPVLDLRESFINTAGNISYSESVEEFLLDNLFKTQLEAILKYYRVDDQNNYTNKEFNKAFYHILAFNTIEINGMNIHDYLKDNFDNVDADTELELRAKALPLIKSYLFREIRTKMKKFPEAHEFIDSKTLKEYEGRDIKDKYKRFLAEYTINTTLGNMFSFQAYAGHPSYYGNIDVTKIENKSDIKSWMKSYDEFESKVHKRAAMLIAPGNIFAESKGKKFAHVALKEVVITSKDIVQMVEQSYDVSKMSDKQLNDYNTLKNLVKKKETLNPTEKNLIKQYEAEIMALGKSFENVEGFFELESTDAQMYVTYKGYLDMLVDEGAIFKEERDAYVKKIENEGQLSKEERDKLRNINLQPRKLVYNGSNYNDVIEDNVPVYIKNSTFPLFPGLTTGNQLDKLRQGLEKIESEEGIPAFASYESANKIGHKDTRITMEDIYNSDGSIPNLESGFSKLDYHSLRVQQATPSKEQKAFEKMQDSKQTLGSQMSKLLMADGINRIKDKIFPNIFQTIDNKEKMLSGEELDDIYFDLYKDYNDQLKNRLERELGVDNMSDFYTLSKDKQRGVINSLRGILKNEVKARNYPQALLDNLNNIVENEKHISFESPFIFDSNSYKFEALLQAVIANRVILHKLPGNSHIVGSSEGFKNLKVKGDDTLTDKDKSEMVFLNSEVAQNGLSANILKGGELQKAQIFIKPHFKYVDSNGEMTYVDFTDPDYYQIDENGNKILNLDKVDPEVREFFSFRIPTSSHQSGAILEVAGFLPPSSQDLLIVPAEHTEQFGEDYDVDARKLYKSNYFIDSEGNVKLLKPEYVDAIANQSIESLSIYTTEKERVEILQETLGIATSTWKGFTEDMDVPYDMVMNDAKPEYQELWFSLFGNDQDKINQYLQEALNAKDDQIETAQALNKAMNNVEKARQRGLALIKRNLSFKLLENDLINVYKSVYSSNDKRVQNKVNKSLNTNIAKTSANIVYDKMRETSGQGISDIMSDETQFRLLKGGADGSVTIGISSKGVVAEAQAQRTAHKTPIELKNYVTVQDGPLKRDVAITRRVTLGEFKNIPARIGLDPKTLDGKRDKSTVHTELQNVNLDNINKGLMAKINQNVHTMSAYVMAAHLGFNETKKEILLTNGEKATPLLSMMLMTQPVMYEYVTEKDKSSLTQDYTSDRELEIVNGLLKKYGAEPINAISDLESQAFLMEDYTEQEMYNAIGKPFENMSDREKMMQLELLKTFTQLNSMAKQWTDAQNSFNFSTSKLGVSYFEVLDKIQKLDELADRHIRGLNAEGGSENITNLIGEVSDTEKEGFIEIGRYWWKPTTIEGLQAINSLSVADKVMPIFYPYQKVFFTNLMSGAKYNKGQDAELTLKEKYELMYEFTSAINAETPVYKIHGDDIDDVIQRIFFDSDDNTSLGTFLETLKAGNHPIMDNPFLVDLSFDNKINRNVKRIIHTTNKDGGVTPEEKTSAFLSLIESLEVLKDDSGDPILFNGKEVTYRDIGLDLVTYQMLSDDKKGAISFKNVLPFEVLQAMGVTKYYREQFGNILDGYTNAVGTTMTAEKAEVFLKQFYQNNPKKANIVKELPVEGMYQPKFVAKYDKKDGMQLFELDGQGNYDQIPIFEGYDTFKQYNLSNSKKSDITQGLEQIKKEKIEKIAQAEKRRKSLELAKNVDNRYKYDDKTGEFRTPQELIQAMIGGKNVSSQHMTALKLLQEQLGDDITIEWVSSDVIGKGRLGSFNHNTNVIRLHENLFSAILTSESIKADNLSEAKPIGREVIIEEMVHAITIPELKKYFKADGTLVAENPPAFAYMLSDMYETAREAAPGYETSDMWEFIASMYASEEFREKLDTELPNLDNKTGTFTERFKRALKNLFNYLMNKGDVSKAYKDEFFKAIDDMFNYAKGKDVQPADTYVNRNVNKYTDQRVKLKKKIKTSKPSGNETQVYNENSIFGDNLSQEMIDAIIADEVTNTDKNNNPC